MEKPLLEFKRFGRKTQRIIEKRAKVCGMEFMGGPQGQVLHIVSHRAKRGLSTFIRDIEHELDISKSVASNLIKRMEKNGSIFLEVSETDKRAKMIHLTAQSKQQFTTDTGDNDRRSMGARFENAGPILCQLVLLGNSWFCVLSDGF